MKNFIKTMGCGLIRTMGGAAVFGAAAVAVYGYTTVPRMDGYLAVGEFALDTVVLALSLTMVYIIGDCAKRGKHENEDR